MTSEAGSVGDPVIRVVLLAFMRLLITAYSYEELSDDQ
jgi:hypothetical protein